MKRNIIVAVVIVVVVFVALAGVKVLQITKLIGFAKTFAPAPEDDFICRRRGTKLAGHAFGGRLD